MSIVDSWKYRRIDEVGVLFSGATPSTTTPSFWDGDIVWVTPYDLSKLNGPYLDSSAKRITLKGLKNCSAQLLPAGSIVISSRAPIGYVAIPRIDYCTNQGCKSIRLKSGYDSIFSYYNIVFHIDKLKILGEGTTFAEISKTTMASIEIPFPVDKAEQSNIASILSTIDKAIEQTGAIIAKQQRIKNGLMHDLLTRGIDKHGNIRSEETHEFKDSPIGRIPVVWDVAPVSKYGAKDRPYLRTGPFGSDLNTKHWVEDGVKVLTIGCLGEEGLLLGQLFSINEETLKALDGFRVKYGDIVLSRVADIGRSLVIGYEQEGWVISSNLMRISLNMDIARPSFLQRNLAYNSAIKSQLRRASNSGGRDLVNGAIFQSLLFPWPHPEEQDVINTTLDEIDNSISSARDSLLKQLSLKTGLMQDLLTGKVRVTPLLEQPPTSM